MNRGSERHPSRPPAAGRLVAEPVASDHLRHPVEQSVHAFAQSPVFTSIFLSYVFVTLGIFGVAWIGYWWLTQKTNASDASSLKRHGLTLQRLEKAMKTSRQRWLWIGEGMFWDARQSFVRPLSTLHLSEGWKTPLQTKLWKLGCAQNAFNSCRKQAELQLRTTKKNPNAAISTIASLLKRGCRGGDGLSCLKLGILLRQGIRLKRDLKRARALLQQACEHRQGHGCLLLGVERQYRQGKHALAPPLYKRGCEYKAALSCAMYANTLVRKGKTPQRCKQAKRWLKRACQLGMKRACTMKLCP